MPRNVLFLIHGIGEHGDDWAAKPVAALSEAAGRYGFFQQPANRRLEDLIDLVPIRYDDIFDRILAGWADLAEGLRGAGALAPDVLRKALGYLDDCGDRGDTFLRYGGDVVLYRGFRLFAQRIQIRVIARIARTIAERRGARDGVRARFSVLAHGLGTAVAHDALHLLGTERWLDGGFAVEDDRDPARDELVDATDARRRLATPAIPNPFAPSIFRFDRIFMIANTSVLLHEIPESPYDSIVRPNTPGHPASYCERYTNVAHRWDPVPRAAPFRMPEAWEAGDHGVDLTGLDHLYDRNVHALAHYLVHPDLHLRILSGLVDGYEIGDDDIAVRNAFPRIGPAIRAAAAEAIETWLKPLAQRVTARTDFEGWLRIYRQFREGTEASS